MLAVCRGYVWACPDCVGDFLESPSELIRCCACGQTSGQWDARVHALNTAKPQPGSDERTDDRGQTEQENRTAP